jgi:hypothetical protein
MSKPDDDFDDGTMQAYRRASAADAGRPSGATRAAILAEARAAAAARAADVPPYAANEPRFRWARIAGGVAASLAVFGVALMVWRETRQDAARRLAAKVEVSAAVRPAPAIAADASRTEAFSARRAEPQEDLAALARREFPAVMQQSRPPAGVWLLLDSAGATVRTGRLAPGESLGAVLESLQAEMPDKRLRPFETGVVTVDGGATMLVGVAREE